MSSEHNSRPLVPEVLVDRGRYAVIRKRPTYDDLIRRDCLPDWKGLICRKCMAAEHDEGFAPRRRRLRLLPSSQTSLQL